MSENSPAFDSVLDLCQHQHRRIVLAALAEEQATLTLNELTNAILKYNHQTPISETSEDTLTKIRLLLHHVHLPKMASNGLINYNSEREFVEPTEQFDHVQPTLATILDADPSLEA